jgi:hypothetical protein
MSLRFRALLAAGMSTSLLAGVAVAESSGATSPETSVATSPETAALEILPPDETWGGATRGEWDARSTQWWMSMPEDVNPLFDTTGARCGYGQSGPVFFLQFGLGEGFTCVVAEGTAIYVSALGVVCSTVEGFEEGRFFGQSEDELRACTARELDESTDGYQQYRVNGLEIADLDSYRIASPLFTLTLPENNIFGVEPGVAQAVSESYSFIVAPPPPGEYEITFSTLTSGQPEGTVNVIVEAARVIEQPTTT